MPFDATHTGDSRLIMGVDGGGSKTAARVASVDAAGSITLLGEGLSGSANLRAVGSAHALANLDSAIDMAIEGACLGDRTVDYAVLALAGSSLSDVQDAIKNWGRQRMLATEFDIVHDADPVLAAGTADGLGVALIVGTGSVAVGVNATGKRAINGGWGHWFGDQGSGYSLGRSALQAMAEAVDETGPGTILTSRILERLHVEDARKVLQTLSIGKDVRREIAALAPIVFQAADESDAVACAIIDNASTDTARLVASSARKLGFTEGVPLALAGGVVCSSSLYRDKLLQHIEVLGIKVGPVNRVHEPVEGSLIMAGNRLK